MFEDDTTCLLQCQDETIFLCNLEDWWCLSNLLGKLLLEFVLSLVNNQFFKKIDEVIFCCENPVNIINRKHKCWGNLIVSIYLCKSETFQMFRGTNGDSWRDYWAGGSSPGKNAEYVFIWKYLYSVEMSIMKPFYEHELFIYLK